MTAQSDTKTKLALELMQKMVANIQKAPSEPKFRKMRLSNPKVAEGLVHVMGARQYLRALGWQIVETEFLELPVEGDGVALYLEGTVVEEGCAAARGLAAARGNLDADDGYGLALAHQVERHRVEAADRPLAPPAPSAADIAALILARSSVILESCFRR